MTMAIQCKNIRISTYILWRVFYSLTELVPYTFVYVNQRNDAALAHIGFIIPSIYGYKRIWNRFS